MTHHLLATAHRRSEELHAIADEYDRLLLGAATQAIEKDTELEILRSWVIGMRSEMTKNGLDADAVIKKCPLVDASEFSPLMELLKESVETNGRARKVDTSMMNGHKARAARVETDAALRNHRYRSSRWGLEGKTNLAKIVLTLQHKLAMAEKEIQIKNQKVSELASIVRGKVGEEHSSNGNHRISEEFSGDLDSPVRSLDSSLVSECKNEMTRDILDIESSPITETSVSLSPAHVRKQISYNALITGCTQLRPKLAKPFTTFAIEVSVGGVAYTISRRYSRFLALHEQLIKEYPTLTPPPLPNKDMFHGSDPNFISKRMMALEQYIKRLLGHKIFSKCELLFSFLELNSACQILFTELSLKDLYSPECNHE